MLPLRYVSYYNTLSLRLLRSARLESTQNITGVLVLGAIYFWMCWIQSQSSHVVV